MKHDPAGTTISATTRAARRLAVTKQHLAGQLPKKASRDDIISLIRDLGYVQWDPISIVAPSHILSIWSRLGNFRLSDLHGLMWEEKRLFEHWTPMASIVLMEDYPLFLSLMERYPGSMAGSWKSQERSARKFLAGHRLLRKKVLNELKKGPLKTSDFKEHSATRRGENAFAPASDISEMLFHMLMSGEVMVVDHDGNQNVWGLSEEFLPDWVEKEGLSEERFEREAALRAIGALGVATPSEINYYFVRGRYRNLKGTIASLLEDSAIREVAIEGFGKRDERYVLEGDVSLLDSFESSDWQPRMSLLPPFDNLICSTARTSKLFGFEYVREQFLPQEKRRFGTYVLPILWGEMLIGRIDPRMDREGGRLVINSVHSEPGAPEDKQVSSGIRDIVEELAVFLGAREVVYSTKVPAAWKGSLC